MCRKIATGHIERSGIFEALVGRRSAYRTAGRLKRTIEEVRRISEARQAYFIVAWAKGIIVPRLMAVKLRSHGCYGDAIC